MILEIIDKEMTPDLNELDRGILALYSLAVTTRPQLCEITGWDVHKVDALLKRMRKLESKPGEWVRSWQPQRRHPYCYTLGPEGVRHAKALRREYAEDVKVVGSHATHYLTTNQILADLIQRGIREGYTWYGPRETGLWFYHEGEARENNPKIRPDAILQAEDGRAMAIEVDLGTIPSPRMKARMHKYLDLAEELPNVPDYLFVATTPRRRAELANCLNRAVGERQIVKPARPDWTVTFHLVSGAAGYLGEWLREPAPVSSAIR